MKQTNKDYARTRFINVYCIVHIILDNMPKRL